MYYITNQTHQVIAADDSLLELLHVESIEELSKQIIIDKIHFTMSNDGNLDITTNDETFTFESNTSRLSSLVGHLNLISLVQTIEKNEVKEETQIDISDDLILKEPPLSKEPVTTDDIIPDIDDDLIFIKEPETPTTFISPQEPEIPTENPIDLLDITDSVDTQVPTTEVPQEELFELTIPKAPEETIDVITDTKEEVEDLTPQEEVPQETSPIVIDISEVSQTIGISTDDYKIFLNEYIDTAIALEDDLKSTDTEKRSSAVTSLTQISEVLQLPYVNRIMSEISLESSTNKEKTIDSFYAILSRLVTTEGPESVSTTVEEETSLTLETPAIEEPEIKLEAPKVEETPLEVEAPVTMETSGFGTIDLSDVQPIHFDFQLEEAANDLSLPVELIEEFVHDFIEQAHIETDKILNAYEKGDLDAIQKIGHMLKGASSNLRINALSDTLYEIQFCEDSSQLEGFIKRYWGHFLSFEQQINILSK